MLAQCEHCWTMIFKSNNNIVYFNFFQNTILYIHPFSPKTLLIHWWFMFCFVCNERTWTYDIRESSHTIYEYKSNGCKCMKWRPPYSGPLTASPSPTRWTISASHVLLPEMLSHCPHTRGWYIAFWQKNRFWCLALLGKKPLSSCGTF